MSEYRDTEKMKTNSVNPLGVNPQAQEENVSDWKALSPRRGT